MYKKIKNGSFMNWIWFILCMLPFVLLIIFSAQYIFNKQNGYRVNNLLQLQNDYQGIDDENITWFENNMVYYSIGFGEGNNQNNSFYYDYDSTKQTTEIFYLDFFNELDDGKNYYFYIKYEQIINSDNISVVLDYYDYSINTITLESDEIFGSNAIVAYGGDNFAITLQNLPSGVFTFKAKISIFICFESINKQDINNWFYVIENSTYSNYLSDINNTIQTNGFISNAFLNLAQFFGVNNVYYSLACYYIEYLLVIVLLHLAFDVLCMLPNICHKFMEKIGGERD